MILVLGVAERKMVFKRLERKKKEVVVVDSLFWVLFVCIVKLFITLEYETCCLLST